MTMQFDFKSVMAKKTDSELFAILAESEKYQPDALLAAKKEMEVRNLSESEMVNAKISYESARQEAEVKGNKGLAFRDYAILLLLPVIGIFIVSGLYRSEGYDTKAKQATKIGVYILAIIFGLVIFINLFS